MDNLSGITTFLQVVESSSFVAASQQLGISASAVGKSIVRLENRLGIRLFHRSTRSMTLTAEGHIFLDRCRKIVSELEAVEYELSQSKNLPSGKLRVSLPLVGELMTPIITEFIKLYPDVQLELDFSDRQVDIIEEGFDVAIRVGDIADSRLMVKTLGYFRLQLVASPQYLKKMNGLKEECREETYTYLLYKFPSTGQIEKWPIQNNEGLAFDEKKSKVIICNTIESLKAFAEQDLGIAYLPDFLVQQSINEKKLAYVLEAECFEENSFKILWPSNRHITSKVRVFIDFLSNQNLFR